MSDHADAESAARRRLTAEQVLDELAEVAALEHAHLVYYLRFHCALDGHAGDDDDVPGTVRTAAGAAFDIAGSDMIHLRDVNRLLVKAGREPVLQRASHVPAPSGPAIDLAPFTEAEFAGFPRREKALAAAVDAKYARLRRALASSTPPALPDEVRQELELVLSFVEGPGMDHASRVPVVAEPLADLAPSQYLRVIGVDPTDELDVRLLGLSDDFYRTLLFLLHDHFAAPEDSTGTLRFQALSRMDDLDKVNGILGLRRLLPPFTAA